MSRKKADTKTTENYMFTVEQLAEFAEVTPRWIYQLIQNQRLFKNTSGLIDCTFYPNTGIVVTMLPPKKLALFDAYIRKRFNLKPPGQDFDE